MRAFFALLLTLLLLFSCAAAQLLPIADTGYAIDIGGLDYIGTSDYGDIFFLTFMDESLNCMLAVLSVPEGDTVDDLLAAYLDLFGDTVPSAEVCNPDGTPALTFCDRDEGVDYMTFLVTLPEHVLWYEYVYTDADSEQQAIAITKSLTYDPAAAEGFTPISLDMDLFADEGSDLGFTAGGVTAIDRSSFTIDLTGCCIFPMDEEDIADDMVIWFTSSDFSLDACIWVYPTDGSTLTDFIPQVLLYGGPDTTHKVTDINGLEFLICRCPSESDTLLEYYTVDGDMYVQISFSCADADDIALAEQIMNTIQR